MTSQGKKVEIPVCGFMSDTAQKKVSAILLIYTDWTLSDTVFETVKKQREMSFEFVVMMTNISQFIHFMWPSYPTCNFEYLQVDPEPNADGLYVCKMCEKAFEKPFYLQRHMRGKTLQADLPANLFFVVTVYQQCRKISDIGEGGVLKQGRWHGNVMGGFHPTLVLESELIGIGNWLSERFLV